MFRQTPEIGAAEWSKFGDIRSGNGRRFAYDYMLVAPGLG